MEQHTHPRSLSLQRSVLFFEERAPLERRLAGELKAERRIDHGLALSVGNVRVLYNAPQRGVFLQGVVSSVKILAYIAEFAWPITLGGERIMLGVFYKLRDPASRESVRVVKNENLPVKLAIYIYTLDPRMKWNIIEKNVEESLKPILETKVQVV